MGSARNLLRSSIELDAYPVLGKDSLREWVYFIGSDTPANLIKIGRTRNLSKRIRSIGLTSPARIFLLKAFNAPRGTEALFHVLFKEHRFQGEWFKPGDALLKFLERDDLPELLVLSHLKEIFGSLGLDRANDFVGILRRAKDELEVEQERWEARFHNQPAAARYRVMPMTLRPLGKL